MTVKLVYQRICFQLKDQVFFGLASLNQAIRPLLDSYNEQMYQQRQTSRKQLFREQEQCLLAPLPEQAYWLLTYRQVRVQKNYHVFLSEDKHYYSVPYQHIGKKVELRYSATLVEIYYANKRIASHPRSRKAAGFSTHQAHMPEHHQYMQGWSTAAFLEWALAKDQVIYNYVEKVSALRDHPEQACRSCWGIQRLGKIYGTERLKSACQRAMLFEQYGYKVLEATLKKNLDIPVDEQSQQVCLPLHENLRGATYYS